MQQRNEELKDNRMKKSTIQQFQHGIVKGLPICFGYIPVSFTFGIMAVSNGIPVWLAIFISLSNLTSAGQFAGTSLIVAGAGYLEIALTTFVINIRYMLMSLALSQKIKPTVKTCHRLAIGYGITDEIFAIAVTETEELSTAYMYGLMLTPVLGWTGGTALGALVNGVLPASLSAAMGIALYAMFIAIIIPPAKKSRAILGTIIASITVTCIMRFLPVFSFISEGFQIILATLVSASFMAAVCPVEDGGEQS